jgi:hypothetical protein
MLAPARSMASLRHSSTMERGRQEWLVNGHPSAFELAICGR